MLLSQTGEAKRKKLDGRRVPRSIKLHGPSSLST